MIYNNESRIIVIDYHEKVKQNLPLKENIRAIEQQAPNHIALYNKEHITQAFLQRIDLLIISIDGWKLLIESKPVWLKHVPSVLIVKK